MEASSYKFTWLRSSQIIYGDVERLNDAANITSTSAHTAAQGAAKNLAKCELVLGVALLMSETLGNAHLPGTQEKIGELIHHALTAVNPRVRYQITPDPMRHLIMSVLPKRTVDKLIAKRLGLLPPA